MPSDEPLRYGLAEGVIARIIAVFAALPEVEKVVLYGSRAKGTFRNGSDIDLVVSGELLNHSHLCLLEGQLDDLLLPYSFDVSLLHQLSSPELLAHISRVGSVIYEKQK